VLHATQLIRHAARLLYICSGCSPGDHGLGLDSTRDQFYAVVVFVLILMVLVSVSVLKGWSRKVSRPAVYGTCVLYGAVISRIGASSSPNAIVKNILCNEQF